MPHVPERLLPALLVVIDPPSHEPPHLLVSENHVVRLVEGDTELLAPSHHQLDEVLVLKRHAAPSLVRDQIHEPSVRFPPARDIRTGSSNLPCHSLAPPGWAGTGRPHRNRTRNNRP